MRFGSVCSGIGAPEQAWKELAFESAWHSEIEPFPSAVFAERHGGLNLGDMTKYKEWPNGSIDILVGGTPCQSFSVAGLRKGIADPRGNLMLTFGAIAEQYRPRWLVWENVPGVLSSNKGRDFGTFLGMLGQLGYGFAYRVLDAQFCGLAQRRKRVFVIGYLGDWRPPAAVLFESESLRGDSPPSREKGERVAASLASSSGGCNDENRAGAFVEWPKEITGALDTTMQKYQGLDNQHINSGAPLFVPMITGNMVAEGDAHSGFRDGDGIVTYGIDEECNASSELFGPLMRGGQGGTRQAVAIHGTQDQCVSDKAFALGRNSGQENAIVACFKGGQGSGAGSIGYSENVGPTLSSAEGGNRTPTLMANMQVRRLSPIECERLQGFPDNFTQIAWNKKTATDCPDGHRYKSLGNSMAVPVMKWIGERIQLIDGLT